MLEPQHNPNPSSMVDPSGVERRLIAWQLSRNLSSRARESRRCVHEEQRLNSGAPHIVEYFHQLDDPYSHLTAQVLSSFAERYEVEIKTHLVRAAGGKNQPELGKLIVWARRDVELIAPHYGLEFPQSVGDTPDPEIILMAARKLSDLPVTEFISSIANVSNALWRGDTAFFSKTTNTSSAEDCLERGTSRRKELGHYSGAMFYYAGEWYWGVDRLFHLEARLRELGACREPDAPYLVERPAIDVEGLDASHLDLDFYPSLNSPYTSIIYDRTLTMKDACDIRFHHKPVLPMIMRGVPATTEKGRYIVFDTQREADFFGVPFGPMLTPIGSPTRDAYSLLPWAREQGKEEALLSSLLHHAFSKGVALHTRTGMRRAVAAAGLDWQKASARLGDEEWKSIVEKNQDEMVGGLGLWGVPSYRLSGGGEEIAVWGQDRLWLIAAEIRRRSAT